MEEFDELGSLLQNFAKQLGIEDRLITDRLKQSWYDCVGENIFSNTEIISFVKGKLTIKTHSPAWKMELKLREKELIEKINKDLSTSHVKSIEIR